MAKDAFERRASSTQQFRGKVHRGHGENFENITKGGYAIRVMYRGREIPTWTTADSDAGIIETSSAVTYKGAVEIRMEKGAK